MGVRPSSDFAVSQSSSKEFDHETNEEALAGRGGCGGGDDDESMTASDPTVVPTSATSSIAAFFAFAKALASSERAEPLSLAQAGTAPVSETDEPTPLPQ